MESRFFPAGKSFIFPSDDDTKKIVSNLKMLGVSENNIERIMHAVNKMPGQDHVKGALKFLTQLTDIKSKREYYYQHSDYIAEWFCTLSNAGLFSVAWYYGDFATLAAASFSALSHAIPSQRLHDLDFLGIFIILGKVMANYKVVMERPDVIAWGAGALLVNVLDTHITRKHLDKIGPSIHVAWHLAAALALYKLNQAQVEASENELQSVMQAVTLNEVPGFLQTSYDIIVDHIYDFTAKASCNLF